MEYITRMQTVWWLKRLGYLVLAAVCCACGLGLLMANAQTGPGTGPEWTAPAAMTLQRVGGVSSIPQEPGFLENLNCTTLTYRLVDSDTMQTGCFSSSALGLMESGSGRIIFQGTDEATPLIPATSQQILVPWPHATEILTLDALSTGGTYVSLYRNTLGAIQDVRNLFGQLTAKRFTAPPDLPLKDAAGNRLVIKPQTLTFSDNGSWLVAETTNAVFIRINLATLEILPFAPGYVTSDSAATLPSRVAITDSGRFVAISNDYAGEFKVYDLQNCASPQGESQLQRCQSYDYRPFVAGKISSLRAIRHVRFVSDDLLTFENRANGAEGEGTYLLTPAASLDFLTQYIGLGDSYTAGQGAYDYLSETDTSDNTCHLSRNSYPLLLANDVFGYSAGHSVACSGAVIEDIGNTGANYHGQVRGGATWAQLQQKEPGFLESVFVNFAPGYIAQQRFVGRWHPRILTVSIGGNDIGFGAILRQCVAPHLSRHLSDNTCFSTYEDRLEVQQLIDRTGKRLTALYRQLRQQAAGGTIYAIGYPQLAVDTGSCGVNVQLNRSEIAFTISLAEHLNKAVQDAAAAAGVSYVDISQALAGHRLCEAASYAVAVNGVTAGKDGGPLGLKVFGGESYHPNAFGQKLIEQAILRQTAHFTLAAPAPVSPAPATPLAAGPSTGRQLYTRIPASDAAPAIGKRGSAVTVQANVAYGIKPGASYAVHLDGPAGPVLGTAVANQDGVAQTQVLIPDTIFGDHTVDITGYGQVDQPIDITQPIFVPSSDTDADGDTLPDDLDTCPGAINSGEDQDADGVDDICDPLIAQPPAPGSTQTATTSSSGSGSGETSSRTQPSAPQIIARLTYTAPESSGSAAHPSTLRQVLGAATSNPQPSTGPLKQAATSFVPKQPAARPGDRRGNWVSYKYLNWLWWIVVPVLIWWLLILVLLLYWLIRRRQYLAQHQQQHHHQMSAAWQAG